MRRALTILAVLASAGASGGAIGCASTEGVVRVVDERPITGPFVPAEAYAAYLRGAVAEAAGDLVGAIEGYSIAVALGPSDPEPWARLGNARCARDPRDAKADDAIARALALDDAYAPAWEARARCQAKRGDARSATESAKRAVRDDPASVSSLAALAESQSGASPELRARLVAMTLASGTDSAAWRALASWARGHRDGSLEAEALVHVAALEPSRGAEIDADVARLAGEGHVSEARRLAHARVANAQRGPTSALTLRFAIDDALLAGDLEGARRCATKGHVPPAVVAARALLLGDVHAARAIAEPLVAADPRGVTARLVLAAAADALHEAKLVTRALAGANPHDDAPVPAEAWLAYARVVAREGSVDAARAFVHAIPREAIVRGDLVTTPLARSLATRGVLDAGDVEATAR